jgi:isoquinoline 1-oxidoreductase beta subunit
MSRIENLSLKRREFLAAGGIAAGALVLGVALPFPARGRTPPGTGAVNAFIAIARDGLVTVFSPFVEMGQGVYTAMAMLVAEELDVSMDAVRIEQAPHGPAYRLQANNTMRFTGGSTSVRSAFEPLRRAGATARAMLIAAAAGRWQVPESELGTDTGHVIHNASDRRYSYADLAESAAMLEPPEQIVPKDPVNFRLLGKPTQRTDVVAKGNGHALFGIDFRSDGMLTAAIRHAPRFGDRVRRFDPAPALRMPGVTAVEELSSAIVVLADNYWHARRALDALDVEFGDGTATDFSSMAHLEKLRGRLDEEGYPVESDGDTAAAFAAAAKAISADYHVPYLAHVTMEPQTCAALVADGRCTVWAPNQGVDSVVETAGRITGLKPEAIEVHTPYLGGGFGRRFVLDFAEEAITLALRHPGRPVRLIWSREEDLQHDYYRPLIAVRLRAALDKAGKPLAWHFTVAGDGPGRQLMGDRMQNPNLDGSVLEGLHRQPYAVPNRRVDSIYELSPAPLGYWRSVGHSQNAFFKESFIDEMAHAAGADPVGYRRALLADQPRYRKVLDTAVAMAGWRSGKWRAADGRQHAMGVALHFSFGSIVAEVAEVSLDNGRPDVHRVWCAVDCGFAVNPLVLVQQMESAVAYGLSAALHEEIEIRNGRVNNENLDSYPILTAREMPDVSVEIINSGEDMGGIGEVGTPPIAPAVCNALFALTGVRVRSLPLSRHSFT